MPLDYSGKMILAPMVKIGTTPTRLLALDYGADIVYTEEIIDWRLLRSERIENKILKTVDFIDTTDSTLVLRVADKERGHLVLQIGTSDPDRAANVAKLVENDVDGIDVNMGCPKSFSLKGGMGSALLTQPEKIKAILTKLVATVKIPVTCKIRILPELKDTLALVKIIEATGVAALAVHGRTKEERQNHPNNVEVIKAVVQHISIPVIANGGSSNNRDSAQNTYEGIHQFWKESGAASVMIARAAEWNTSVFMKEGKEDIFKVISKYLDYAIDYDYTFVVVKYNIQQIMGGEQDTPLGKSFLSCSTMKELCAILGKEEVYLNKQDFLLKASQNGDVQLSVQSNLQNRNRRDFPQSEDESMPPPKKRKLCELNPDHFKTEHEEVTEMFFPFVRGHYSSNNSGSTESDIPKALLHSWTFKSGLDKPVYFTWQKDKMFRSVVTVKGESFSSESWEKNKRFSEQAAALVALHCLDIQKFRNIENSFRNS